MFFLYLFPGKGTLTDAPDGDGGGKHFLFDTKIQNSIVAAVEIWILLSINTYLISKLKNDRGSGRVLNSASYHFTLYQKFKIRKSAAAAAEF